MFNCTEYFKTRYPISFLNKHFSLVTTHLSAGDYINNRVLCYFPYNYENEKASLEYFFINNQDGNTKNSCSLITLGC